MCATHEYHGTLSNHEFYDFTVGCIDKVLTDNLGLDTPRPPFPWALNPGNLPTCYMQISQDDPTKAHYQREPAPRATDLQWQNGTQSMVPYQKN